MEVREPDARYLTAVQRTELGELPADWEVVRLSDIATVTSGKRLPLGESLTTSETPHPYIRVSDMGRGTVDATAIQFVPVNVFPKIQQYRIFSTDLYISVAGTLGLVGQIPTALDGANLTENANRIAGIRGSKAYLYQVLASPLVQTVIESERTVGAQPKLALGRIRNFSIPLPPTSEEQVAIGSALADADALVDSLEQLLTKKRQIKQGAMHELLTGKRRLPGFSGEWEKKRLGEIAELMKGSGLSRDLTTSTGRRKCILYGELFTTYGQVILDVVSRTNSSDGVASISGDVLVPGSTTTDGIDLATASALLESDVALGGDINIVRPKDVDSLDSRFLANYLTHVKRREIAERAQGTTIVHLYGRDLSDLWLHQPNAVEQVAISEVFSEMDAEITGLESRLNKARALKQAMAQALLTGRIRLVEPAA